MWTTISSFFTDTVWKYITIVLSVLMALSLVYIIILRFENSSLQNDVTALESDKKLYIQAIDQAKANQKTKIEYVDREVKVIEYKTVQKLIPVKEYVYDTNKTNCANGMSVLRASGL